VKLYTFGDGKMIGAFAASDGVVALAFHLTAPQLVGVLKNNAAVVWSVAFTAGQPLPPDFGKPIFSRSATVTVRQHRVRRRRHNPDRERGQAGAAFRIASDVPVKSFTHPNLVDAVAFDDTGNVLATGWPRRRVAHLRPVQSRRVEGRPRPHPDRADAAAHPIYAIAWTPDHKQILTASYDKTVKLWDATGGTM